MDLAMTDSSEWLTLGEAADRLGVHPNTLRRWADQGRIPFMLTLGGHRRFGLHQIEELLAEQQQQVDVKRVAELWITTTLATMRANLSAGEDPRWVTEFDSNDRSQKRVLGRRMMELLLQYVSGDAHDEIILAEARSMGTAYAEGSMAAGLSVTMALRAILFFRDTLTVTVFDLPDGLHIPPSEQKRLLGRTTDLLDQVELAIVASYEAAGSATN